MIGRDVPQQVSGCHPVIYIHSGSDNQAVRVALIKRLPSNHRSRTSVPITTFNNGWAKLHFPGHGRSDGKYWRL